MVFLRYIPRRDAERRKTTAADRKQISMVPGDSPATSSKGYFFKAGDEPENAALLHSGLAQEISLDFVDHLF